MGKKVNPALIGAFVLGAIGLAIVGVVLFGSGRLFRETYKWVAYFSGSVNGLRKGAPVKFKGVEVGSVADIRLNLGTRVRAPEDIRIPVIIELDADRISAKGARVAMDAETLKQQITQGMRAQLNTESFVTGVLYVELDYFPGTPARLVADPDVPYPEIPTLPTTLEQVQMKASEIINKLSDLDLKALVQSARETVDGMNRLINSPDLQRAAGDLDETVKNVEGAAASLDKLAKNLDASLPDIGHSLRAAAKDTGAAVGSVQTLLAPGSPLTYQLGQTLEQLAGAARSLQRLADYLERNPSALVRGRPVPEGNP